MLRNRRIARVLGGLLLLAAAAPVLAQTPKDIVLMLDNSGSMMQNDPKFLSRVAVRRFLDSLGPSARVSIVIFDQKVSVPVPLTKLTDATRPRFLAALAKLDFKGQFTNTPAALERSIYELETHARAGAEKSIVLMTDGIVDTGNKEMDVERTSWMREDLASAAADAGIRIFGIAFTESADFLLIQSLAQKTHGAYFRALSAGDIDGVFNHIVAALARPLPAPAPVETATAPAASATTAAESATTAAPGASPATAPASGEPSTTATPAGVAAAGASGGTGAAPGAESAAASGAPALPSAGSSAPALPPSSPASGSETSAAPSLPPLPEAAKAPESSTASKADEALAAAAQDSAAPATQAKAPEPGAQEKAPEPGAGAPPAATKPAGAAPARRHGLAVPATWLVAAAAVLLLLVLAVVWVLVHRRRQTAAKPPPATMPKAFLNDLAGATGQSSYELGEKLTIVGRLEGPDVEGASYIVIDEPTIGRRHAMIEYKDHSFWVVDQNSLNGTFVNNRRIESEQRLKHGDRLRFHKHEFEFLVLDMFETDRTMISNTVFADFANRIEAEDGATAARGRVDVTTDPGTSTSGH